MPLVKDLNVSPDLYLDTFRKREFILSGDFVRRIELGKDVSMRASTLKPDQLAKVLVEISEPGATFNREALEAYDNAQDWLCKTMNNVLPLAKSLGVRPADMKREVTLYHDSIPKIAPTRVAANRAVWIPVCSMYVKSERVYLFRVVPMMWMDSIDIIDASSSGCVGYTTEYLKVVSPELWSYIDRLERKANKDPNVQEAFRRLAAFLRPESMRQEELAKQQALYGTSFGEWA